MKILKLKALNINSLKGETLVDFTKLLNDNALFAITGPTGAGKSTILDIITCALYGRTPRLKNPNELMARHTGECYCEVEFEVKEIIYRSSWTQKRARKNASGKFQTAKMELSIVNSAQVLKSTLRDVPKYIEELSGLDFDRFIQSMMLAQGSFDAFLKAKESDRSTLLEKITGTQIYAKISKEIYDRYMQYKSDIDSDKKILDFTSLLDVIEVEEKTILLQNSKEDKVSYDKVYNELNTLKTWIETLSSLEKNSIEYEALFVTISKEKEDKKEDFLQLLLATKALNVQTIYDKTLICKKEIQKDELKSSELFKSIEDIDKELYSIDTQYEVSQQETLRVKKELDENTLKIKEIRILHTQIEEKEKQLLELKNTLIFKNEEKTKYKKKVLTLEEEYSNIETKLTITKEYIELHKTDEKILESLSSIVQEIELYEHEKINLIKVRKEKEDVQKEHSIVKQKHILLSDEVQQYNEVLNTKIKEYTNIEEQSQNDIKNEPVYRENQNKYTALLKEHKEYINLTQTIVSEEQSKQLNIKEIEYLTESINSKTLVSNELYTHIQTLKEKRETELLIIKYEDDRKKIKQGDECFLCGSTTHPYIINNETVNIDTTNESIKVKEELYTTNERELTTLKTKQIQLTTKQESIILELIKLNELCESKKEVFKKESINLDDEIEQNIQEKIVSYENALKEILNRREEKEKLLKEKEGALQNYTAKHTLFSRSEKELEKFNLLYAQMEKEELSLSKKTKTLISHLSCSFEKFDLVFDEVDYRDELKNLTKRNDTFIENTILLKELETRKNNYDLEQKENDTKLTSLTAQLDAHEETSVELSSYISSMKDEAIEILNIADINMFELQLKNNFEKAQKTENNLKEEQTSLSTKITEYKKQQKILHEEILKNNELLKTHTITLEKELLANDFKDIETLQKSILPNEQREELFASCQKIENEYKNYQALNNDTALKLTQYKENILTEKSLEEILKELNDVKIKTDELQLQIGEISAILKRNEEDRAKHQEKIQLLEKKQMSFKVWIKLNEMIGSADGNKFAKFAQGITLDQLINLANSHLNVLSNRYELLRSQDEKHLLEIEVCDSFQGDVIRPVSTLSGGESFIVSLSLALGLSELASHKIAIDSLFLDEGFGTLDEDSLETALNALNLLQSRGKMVGVISHVEALKERIPLQIKVVPKGDGTSYIEKKG